MRTQPTPLTRGTSTSRASGPPRHDFALLAVRGKGVGTAGGRRERSIQIKEVRLVHLVVDRTAPIRLNISVPFVRSRTNGRTKTARKAGPERRHWFGGARRAERSGFRPHLFVRDQLADVPADGWTRPQCQPGPCVPCQQPAAPVEPNGEGRIGPKRDRPKRLNSLVQELALLDVLLQENAPSSDTRAAQQ